LGAEESAYLFLQDNAPYSLGADITGVETGSLTEAGDRLEGVRETLALAIEELDRKLNEHERPEFWELLSELMFRASRKASGGSDLRLRNQVIVSSNQWSVIRTPSFLFFPS
jgi:hypothetical protein